MRSITDVDWFVVACLYGTMFLVGLAFGGYLVWAFLAELQAVTRHLARLCAALEQGPVPEVQTAPPPLPYPPFVDEHAEPDTPGGVEQDRFGTIAGRPEAQDTRTWVHFAPDPLWPDTYRQADRDPGSWSEAGPGEQDHD